MEFICNTIDELINMEVGYVRQNKKEVCIL